MYSYKYKTPDGIDDIVLYSDGIYLTSLIFDNEFNNEYYKDKSIFEDTIKWLDLYFKGERPNFIPKYKTDGISEFSELVYSIIKDIPYGEVTTYGKIAKKISIIKGVKMSPRAIGNALNKNKILIIIPCHRVVSSNKINGYKCGINNKMKLLEIEGIDLYNE